MSKPAPPIPTPLAQRILHHRQRHVPALVWVGAVFAATFLLGGKSSQGELVGLARAQSYSISASATGQLEAVTVQLYDTVEAGQVLARLDDSEIGARLERSRATMRQLMAALEAERARLSAGTGRASDLRRFQVDEEQRKLRALELRATIEADEIELRRLLLERERAVSLFEEGLLSEADHDRARLRHDEAARRYESNKSLLQEMEGEYATAHRRRQQFERDLPGALAEEPALAPLREAIDIERHRLEEILHRRESLVLRSPVAGHVSRVAGTQGETVVRGDPIVTVTEDTVSEIVAYLDESNDRPIPERLAVRVTRARRTGRSAESHVVRLSPSLEALPRRLWRTPDAVAFGQAVVIAVTPGLQLVPGEIVRVELLGD